MRVGFAVTLTAIFMAGVTMLGCSGAASSQPELRSSASPVPVSKQNLTINQMPEKYSYDDFIGDLQKLQSNYSGKIHCVKLCDTHDGRGVYDIVLGDPNGPNQALIFGAMHAREYITTQVVMRQLCDAIDVLNGFDTGTYRDQSKKALLENCTIHFIPMNNPDGVSISQFGLAGIRDENLREAVAAMADDDFEQWKANGTGVDLNRNFDAGWYEFGGSPAPAAERYKGAFPGSEPESAALIKLTEKYNLRRAISYHTCGALIYWYYMQSGDVLAESQRFAGLISEETGYPLDDDYTAVDAAGYKDWAVYKMGIPSITIEIGAEMGRSIENPVPISRFDDIWEQNRNVVYAVAYSLL